MMRVLKSGWGGAPALLLSHVKILPLVTSLLNSSSEQLNEDLNA